MIIVRLNDDEIGVLLDNVQERLLIANEDGSLEILLSKIGCDDLLQKNNTGFYSYPTGKIFVLGGSECPENRLLGVAKELGLDKKRFEFCLDYKKAVKYDYRHLQYRPEYRVILAGPVPHKTSCAGDYASTISKLENTPGYPKVERLTANQALKITKSNFTAKLTELLERGFLIAKN